VELRHLRSFVVLAEELHFARAARRLHVVQPALSQQIRALEGEIGAALFERTTRRVSLTPVGEVFLEHARRSLADVAQGVLAAQQAGRGMVGRLGVSHAPASVLAVKREGVVYVPLMRPVITSRIAMAYYPENRSPVLAAFLVATRSAAHQPLGQGARRRPLPSGPGKRA
jgi:DNA-binding transcriptional LysR family regulator